MKKCPFCGERIGECTEICPFCKEKINGKSKPKSLNFKNIFTSIAKSIFIVLLLIVIGIVGKYGYMYYMSTSLYGTTKLGLEDLDKGQVTYKDTERNKIYTHAYAISSNALRKYNDKDMPYAIKGAAAMMLSGLRTKNYQQRKENHYYKESVELTNKALSINPNNYVALETMSTVNSLEKNYDAALKNINKAIEQNEECARLYFARATVKTYVYKNEEDMRKNYKDFITDIDRAIELAPKNPMYYYIRANVKLVAQKDLESALEDTNKSIELIKNPPAAYYFARAHIKGNMGNYSSALEDCDKAIALCEQDDSLSEFEKNFFDLKLYQAYRKFLIDKI